MALRQDKQRKLPFQITHVFCLSCPSATFALQRGGFLPREWLAGNGLFILRNIEFMVLLSLKLLCYNTSTVFMLRLSLAFYGQDENGFSAT